MDSFLVSKFGVSRGLVAALLASFLVLVSPTDVGSNADYISVQPGSIIYNDRACNLGDPNDHSTSATAFEISTSEQLWEITDCVSNSATTYFKLGDNIDVSDASKAGAAPTSSPIGFSTSALAYSFSGVLDGNNKTISGISMSSSLYGVGLFAKIQNSTISNLAISGSFQTGATSGADTASAGALAIWGAGQIQVSSVSSQGTVFGYEYVGGLIGRVQGDANFESVQNGATVQGNRYVGGVVGRADNSSTFSNVRNSGPVSGSRNVGGLAGYLNMDAWFYTSHNLGKVTAGTSNAGGLVGNSIHDIFIHSSSNTATVSAQGWAAGLVASLDIGNALIEDSFNSGAILGLGVVDGYVGGLIGSGNDATIRRSTNSGAITGHGSVGGILGNSDGSVSIENSKNEGDVSSDAENVGGLIGYAYSNTLISASSNIGSISGLVDYVGGLAGYVRNNVDVENSINGGGVSGANYVGGLVGHVRREADIRGSRNSGVIQSTDRYIGGLVGFVGTYANILSSQNTATISAGVEVGGLLGHADSSTTINSSHNTGQISGTGDSVGGLVGYVANTLAANNSFNSAPVFGANYAGGLLGQGTDIASFQATYNSGSVSGAQKVGGLAGYLLTLESDNSYNSGEVDGSGDSVGGLVGQVISNATVTSSYNVGAISGGEDAIGGLIGKVEVGGETYIVTSYNAGALSGSPLSIDGIAADASSPTINQVYTLVDSNHVSSSTLAQMQLASTYAGFNFTTTWGFSTCAVNNGLPLLRVFNPGLSTTATGCLVSGGSGGPAGTNATPAPAYAGPIVSIPAIAAEPSQQTVISGKKLGSVTVVSVNGIILDISSVSDEAFTIQIPAELAPGVYDLVIISDFGKLTVMGFIKISPSTAQSSSFGELLGYRWTDKFEGNSRVMNPNQERSVDAALSKFEADTIVCWGYTTALDPNAWAITHATARAKSACGHISRLDPSLRTVVRLKYGVPKHAAMRVSLQFWALKSVN